MTEHNIDKKKKTTIKWSREAMTKETEKKGILVFILCGTVFYLTVPNFISKGTVLDNSLTAMVAYLRPLFFELRKIVVSSPILAASASQR